MSEKDMVFRSTDLCTESDLIAYIYTKLWRNRYSLPAANCNYYKFQLKYSKIKALTWFQEITRQGQYGNIVR